MCLREKKRRRRKFYDFYPKNAPFKRFSIFLKTNFWFSKTPGGASSPLSPPPGYAPAYVFV